MKLMLKIAMTVALAGVPALASAQFTPVKKTSTRAELEAQIRAQVRAQLAAKNAGKNGGSKVSWKNNSTTAAVQNTASWGASQAPSSRVQQEITSYAPTNQAAISTMVAPGGCEQAIARAERKYNLPPYLLLAIAITESGRNNRPNPLAMNIMGRSHYARSPQEVVSIVQRYGSRSSIDIGCAQINLKYHGARFPDWTSLIQPEANAEYAAYHLTELRREMGSWSRAVSAYHSRTPWRGMNYACLVSRRYGQIFGDNRRGCGPNIEMLTAYLYRTVKR